MAQAESSRSAPSLSSFVRDAVREKAGRELAVLRGQLDAFQNLRDAQAKLGEASTALTAFLGALPSLGAESGAIARAKKMRKLLDEAKDGAEAVADALAIASREEDARARREAILAELEAAGIALDTPGSVANGATGAGATKGARRSAATEGAPSASRAEALPSLEEPSLEEPSLEEPSLEEPSLEEPSLEEPSHEEPSHEEPAKLEFDGVDVAAEA